MPTTTRTSLLAMTLLIVAVYAFSQSMFQSATEAPTGFSTPTLSENHGALSESNGMPFDAGETFADVQATFEEQDGVDEGLGPVYNAQSCVACHQNPVTGGSSQVSELRVGHRDRSGRFVNPNITINYGNDTIANRSLINDRAICAEAQELAPTSEGLQTFRLSLSVLGDGFVEAIADSTLTNIADSQRRQSNGKIVGQAISVPILESSRATRIGRFGWKDQHASLLSFSADAYLNEQGVTSRLQPKDTTSVCKTTPDPEDDVEANGKSDIDEFAQFIRATKAPPVDAAVAATADAQAGAKLFAQVGCATCHVSSITTAPAGTVLNGGKFTVPPALGNKVIHPYSDFLLHDVGTGDGIVQNGPPETANKFRTAPLWGLRTRNRLMHDGQSLSRPDAIARHAGEATSVMNNYRSLSSFQKNQLLRFLDSL